MKCAFAPWSRSTARVNDATAASWTSLFVRGIGYDSQQMLVRALPLRMETWPGPLMRSGPLDCALTVSSHRSSFRAAARRAVAHYGVGQGNAAPTRLRPNFAAGGAKLFDALVHKTIGSRSVENG